MKRFVLFLIALSISALAFAGPSRGYARPQDSAGPVVQAIWDKCFVQKINVWGSLFPCSITPMVHGVQAPHRYTWDQIPSPSKKRALGKKYHCPGPDLHCTAPDYYILACEVPAPPPTEPTVSQVGENPAKFDTFAGFLCGAHVIGYHGRDGVDYVIIDGSTTGVPTPTPHVENPPLPPVPPTNTPVIGPAPTNPPPPTATPHIGPAPTSTPHFGPAPTKTAVIGPAPTVPPTVPPTPSIQPNASASPAAGCGGQVGLTVGTAIAALFVIGKRLSL